MAMDQSHTNLSSLPWLVTSGRKIIAADTGREVILRGTNSMYPEWHNNDMSWTRRAIAEIATNWRGNVIVRGFASDPLVEHDQGYLASLDEYVTLTAAHGMYLIFSWRSFAQGDEQPPMPNDAAISSMVMLAARYKGLPHVCYSLQCEPHDVPWQTLRPLFENMVDKIRQAAAPSVPLIFVPGASWSMDLSEIAANPVRRANVVYNIHYYDTAAHMQSSIGDVYNANMPVFVGEFGPWGEGSMKIQDVPAFLAFARQHGISWAAWNLDYDTDPLLNFDLTPTTPYGAMVKNEMMHTPPVV